MTIQTLYSTIWITRGARFQAYKRLKKIDALSTWTINLLSIYITGIGLLALAPPDGLKYIESKTWTILISVFSILIMVISLLESSKKYASMADKMHSCAKELSTIYHRVSVLRNSQVSDQDLLSLISSYQEIIDRYDDNHKDVDFEYFKAYNWKEFGINQFVAFFTRMRIVITSYILFYAVMILPVIYMYINWPRNV